MMIGVLQGLKPANGAERPCVPRFWRNRNSTARHSMTLATFWASETGRRNATPCDRLAQAKLTARGMLMWRAEEKYGAIIVDLKKVKVAWQRMHNIWLSSGRLTGGLQIRRSRPWKMARARDVGLRGRRDVAAVGTFVHWRRTYIINARICSFYS